MTILRYVNLVSNIGFNEDGTHTIPKDSPLANMPVEQITFSLSHTLFVLRHRKADNLMQQNIFQHSLIKKFKNKINSFLSLYFVK